MTGPNLDDRPLRRHDLIFVRTTAWRALLQLRVELAGEPLVARWVERGWPLVLRRLMPGETHGVPLGLPLPPFAGKRRLSFLMPRTDVIAAIPPLSLRAASRAAPRAWWPTLHRLDVWASRHGVDARVFGGLAWTSLTGLDYLTNHSDLDLLLHVHRDADLVQLTADIAEIEADAPMLLDGEIVRDDGVAVNWREIHTGAREIVAKSVDGVALLDTSLFLAGRAPPS